MQLRAQRQGFRGAPTLSLRCQKILATFHESIRVINQNSSKRRAQLAFPTLLSTERYLHASAKFFHGKNARNYKNHIFRTFCRVYDEV